MYKECSVTNHKESFSVRPKPLPRTVFTIGENVFTITKDDSSETTKAKISDKNESQNSRLKTNTELDKNSERLTAVKEQNPEQDASWVKDQTTSQNKPEGVVQKSKNGTNFSNKAENYKSISCSLISLPSGGSATNQGDKTSQCTENSSVKIKKLNPSSKINLQDYNQVSPHFPAADKCFVSSPKPKTASNFETDIPCEDKLKPKLKIYTQHPKRLSQLDKRKNKSTPSLICKSESNDDPCTSNSTSNYNNFVETSFRPNLTKRNNNENSNKMENSPTVSDISNATVNGTDDKINLKTSNINGNDTSSLSSSKKIFSFSLSLANFSQKLGLGPLRKYAKYNNNPKLSSNAKNNKVSSISPRDSISSEITPQRLSTLESTTPNNISNTNKTGPVNRRKNPQRAMTGDNNNFYSRELPPPQLNRAFSTPSSGYHQTRSSYTASNQASRTILSDDSRNRSSLVDSTRPNHDDTESSMSLLSRTNERDCQNRFPSSRDSSSNINNPPMLLNDSVFLTTLTQHGYSSKKMKIPLKNLKDFRNAHTKINEILKNGRELLYFSKYSQVRRA